MKTKQQILDENQLQLFFSEWMTIGYGNRMEIHMRGGELENLFLFEGERTNKETRIITIHNELKDVIFHDIAEYKDEEGLWIIEGKKVNTRQLIQKIEENYSEWMDEYHSNWYDQLESWLDENWIDITEPICGLDGVTRIWTENIDAIKELPFPGDNWYSSKEINCDHSEYGNGKGLFYFVSKEYPTWYPLLEKEDD